jgi:hypothetical protein
VASGASLALAEGIEVHCNSKSQVHMTPPVSKTGSVGTFKRAPASSVRPLALLRARREWPRDRPTAEQRDELAPLHVLPSG